LSTHAELISDLRQIDVELDRVESAWLLFLKSTKDFSEDQDTLLDLVTGSELVEQFELVQMILLHDCVATLSRVMDEPRTNRVTLKGAMSHANLLYAERRIELRPISKKLGAIQTSAEMQSLRRFRDRYVGHNLKEAIPDTKHASIPFVADRISSVVNDLFSLGEATRWIGQTSRGRKTVASENFWSCFELGMKTK
jgi:hypothetical protein